MYDLAVVGAGPAGLQAAVAGASEGLSVVVFEKAPTIGGQIGQTPRFENSILGMGQTGPELVRQFRHVADRFGVDFVHGEAYSLSASVRPFITRWRDGQDVGAVTSEYVILSLGKRWVPVLVPGLPKLVDAGLATYGPGAAVREGWDHTDSVIVYGGGPAAGQAAVVLAERGVLVTLVCRGEPSMPRYLMDNIESDPNVTIMRESMLFNARLTSSGRAEVALTNGVILAGIDHVLICAGQRPDTDWLKGGPVQIDDGGLVVVHSGQTGTNVPGVFAVGDCRVGSTARVGSAIGDGSMALTELWRMKTRADRRAVAV